MENSDFVDENESEIIPVQIQPKQFNQVTQEVVSVSPNAANSDFVAEDESVLIPPVKAKEETKDVNYTGLDSDFVAPDESVIESKP